MNARPQLRIGFRLAKHLPRDRRGVPFPERQKLQQISDGIALGPAEIRVRNLKCLVADEQQQRGDRVGNRGTPAAQHMVPADVDALDLEDVAEVGRVGRPDFDEQHARVGRQMMRLLRLAQLVRVLAGRPVSGLFAIMRIGACVTSWRNLCAIASAVTPCTRSSVERRTREIIEVTTIVTMNHVAICTPSGRSMTLVTVV